MVQYRCKCGNKRRESNHWYAAQIAFYGAVYVYTWDRAAEMGILNDSNTEHLCGHQCVTKLLDDWMTEKRTEGATDAA